MALNLDSKKVVVDEVAQYAAKALSVVAAEYRGLTVSEMTELRNKAREANVYLRVVKNSLAKRAIEGTEFECVKDGLKGPLIMAFSMEAPGAAARIISDFAKENNNNLKISFSEEWQEIQINTMDTLIWSDESNLEASIKWEDLQIALNSEFLIAILNVIKSNEVVIELNWAYAPVLFKNPEDDSFLHIIMPLRV